MRLSDKAGDRLFRHYNGTLNGLARGRVGRQDAEDIVQNAYLRLLALENASHVANTRSYLFRIVSNVAKDWLRKQRGRSAYFVENVELEEIAASSSGVATAVEDVILLYRTRSGLSQLPRCCGESFVLSCPTV